MDCRLATLCRGWTRLSTEQQDGPARGLWDLFRVALSGLPGHKPNRFQPGYTHVPSIDNGLNFRFNLGGYPFPDGFLTPAGASGGLTTNLGGSVTFLNPAKRQGYSQRWSFNIERQIGHVH